MAPEILIPIIVAFLGMLGGGGFWNYYISRRDAPVKKAEADMAVAEKSQQMAMKIAERLDIDYTSVRADLSVAQQAIVSLTEQVKSLEDHGRDQDRTISSLRRMVQAFSDAWDDLAQHWERYRLLDVAPLPPSYPPLTPDQERIS